MYRGRKRTHLPVQVSGSSSVTVRLGPFASVSDPCSRGFDSRRLHLRPSLAAGSSLGNVHFHTLVPDGVFDVSGEAPARFPSLPPPSDEEVSHILVKVIHGVLSQ